MFRAVVRQDGSLQLGEEARRQGYGPGTVVEIVVTRAGSLILAIDQSPPALDVSFRALEGGRAQLAARTGQQQRRRAG